MRWLVGVALLTSVGCGGGETSSTEVVSDPETAANVSSLETTTDDGTAPAKPKRTIKPLDLGGDNSGGVATTQAGTSVEASVDDIIEKLKPLQVLLGSWRGTTRREFDGFKAVDQHEWVWDLQMDPEHPALVMTSGGKSPYVTEARITWNAETDKFVLTIDSPEGEKRKFVGEFTKPIDDVAGDDGKLQRTFALQFTQTEPADAKEQFQYTFNQQENNRYLMEISKKRGKATFRRFDTVSTQRDGTSFAISDSDYGEKTCIISAGLGTISVSYQGKTYWVCCTGCKAAFEEDPERWIKRAEEEK